MQLAAYLFVGLRQIAPDTDPGIDFTEEYRLAAARREARLTGRHPTHRPSEAAEGRGPPCLLVLAFSIGIAICEFSIFACRRCICRA